MYREKARDFLKNLNHDMSNRERYYGIIEKLVECDLCENSIGNIHYGFLNRDDVDNNDNSVFVEYLKGKSVEIPNMIDTDVPCVWFSELDFRSNSCSINVFTIRDYVEWMVYAIVEHNYSEEYVRDFLIDVGDVL